MDISFYTSPMSEEIRAEGEARGKAKGRAEDILRLLELRHVAVTGEAREKITGCRDLQLLNQWFSRAVTARTTDEMFAQE